MFITASGINIPHPELIKEEFEMLQDRIILNLSFEKLPSFLEKIIKTLEEPLFFVLQLPLDYAEELKLRESNFDQLHKAVYYLDGLSTAQLNELLCQYGSVLLNDGISEFGIASHGSGDEIFILKYKVICIFSKNNLEKYRTLVEKLGVEYAKEILTPYNTFPPDSPGEVSRVTIDGLDVFKIRDKLLKQGMYLSKIIEG